MTSSLELVQHNKEIIVYDTKDGSAALPRYGLGLDIHMILFGSVNWLHLCAIAVIFVLCIKFEEKHIIQHKCIHTDLLL